MKVAERRRRLRNFSIEISRVLDGVPVMVLPANMKVRDLVTHVRAKEALTSSRLKITHYSSVKEVTPTEGQKHQDLKSGMDMFNID
jgi:hypothetical protein